MAAGWMFPVVAFMGLWPFCLVRVVSGFRVFLMSYAEGYRHHYRMPSATGDICHGRISPRLIAPVPVDPVQQWLAVEVAAEVLGE
jgi:hypothetical protein